MGYASPAWAVVRAYCNAQVRALGLPRRGTEGDPMAALGAATVPATRGRRAGKLRALPAPESVEPGGLIARPELVERLMGVPEPPLTLLVAPAGYGKSALLADWASHDPRPFAWVRVLRSDDDVASLVSHAVRGLDSDFVLVLDDVHNLRDRQALELVSELLERLPAGARVVMAGRSEPGVQVARLRAERRTLELGPADLALTRAEVGAIAAASGLELDERGRDLLARRTEGWPAGVYLAALAVRGEDDPAAALGEFSGADRIVTAYLCSEVLAALPRRLADFLKRSSILGRLSAPACDHLLERDDSGRVLAELARSGSLIVPLDRTGSEYRCHTLLAEALRGELKRNDPKAANALHARASAWYEAAGDRGPAMEHALAAGDLGRAGRLLWDEAPALIAYGHGDRLAARLERFMPEQIAACPPLALSAAAAQLALGDRALAEHWVSAARSAGALDRSLAGGARAIQAALATSNVRGMRSEAARAYSEARADSPWRSLACFAEGVALHLAGNRDRARERLDEGARRGAAVAPLLQVLCLAQLALVALDEGDWHAADTFVARARAQTERVALGEYPTTALVFAVSAAVRAHYGQVDLCEHDALVAERLLTRLVDFSPWYTAECRTALASAALRLNDLPGARALLDDAERDLSLVHGATAARAALDLCRGQCDLAALSGDAAGEALTSAELRVLQFLPTHLSFPEIADELYVSRNTVKTHVRAVYRKLMVSSRNDAVSRARDAGLLENA